MAVLLFADGPAAGQRVENVDPTDVRWFCEWQGPDQEGTARSWWAWTDEPPASEDLTITKYRVISVRADYAAPEGDPNPTIQTYAVAQTEEAESG